MKLNAQPDQPALRRTLAPVLPKLGGLRDHFRIVMNDEGGQAAVEFTIMLAMLTGSIIATNEIFDVFVTDYINGIMFFLQHP